MHGANRRFMTKKAAWLADHLILYTVSKGSPSGNPFNQTLSTVGAELPVQDFDLRKIGDIINQGGSAKLYELRGLKEKIGPVATSKTRKISSSTHALKAYFLPWGSNRTFCGKLGTKADYFFTPTLNGCTFAYSGVGPGPSVAHANFVNSTTTLTDQNAINTDLTGKFGGTAPAHTLIKTDYKTPTTGFVDYHATVVGIRTGNGWNFYYQSYKVELKHGKLVHSGENLCVPI